jgi:hypothetical protein
MKSHPARITDPPLTRKKGAFTHFGSWVYLALGVLFVGYTFGLIPHEIPARIFGKIAAQRDHVLALSALAVPAGVLLGILVVLYLFLRLARNLGKAVQQQSTTLPAPKAEMRPPRSTAKPTPENQPGTNPASAVQKAAPLPRPANPYHAAEPISRAEHRKQP